MTAPICCAMVQKTASEATSRVGKPEFGHGEVAERPIAAPKVSSTNDRRATADASLLWRPSKIALFHRVMALAAATRSTIASSNPPESPQALVQDFPAQ